MSRPERVSGTRRRVLQAGLALLALPLVAGARCAGGPATPRVVPARARGSTRIDVRAMGARGDGRTDDTAAFQKAVDALPAAGGTVLVPAGNYLIDAVQSIRLRSRMCLQLAPDAVLSAIPNGARQATVIFMEKISDVEIIGGRIVGERDRHLVQTGEWGHGIRFRGASRVNVRDIHISNCWGDGICMGGADEHQRTPSVDVVIAGVTCTGNRRQGLSIGRTRHVRVYDSEFSDTAGTAPQFGIDVEPDRPGDTQDVRIENCVVRNNKGGGIQLYRRVNNVVVQDCTIEGNRGQGILAVGVSNALVAGNCIRGNGGVGLGVRPEASSLEVRDNVFADNAGRARARALSSGGRAARAAAQLEGQGSAVRVAAEATDIRIGANTYQ
ncbi:MAG: right-handed parallel beta-helix repeat-containing protein [Lysobacteraceae bacterium]